MATRTRPSNLAPRLTLLFAVVFCLLGLGQVGAAAQTSPTASTPSAVAADSHHLAHQPEPDLAPTELSLATSSGEGHAGHGSEAGHALNCMSASAVAAIGAVAIADAANLVAPVFFAPISHMRSAVLAVSYPRSPDLTTLCVQRI